MVRLWHRLLHGEAVLHWLSPQECFWFGHVRFSLEPKGLALGSCSHGGLGPRQEDLLSFWCRKAADHVGAAGRRRHPGQHRLLHLQGRGQPQARDHLAAEQVSASGWGAGCRVLGIGWGAGGPGPNHQSGAGLWVPAIRRGAGGTGQGAGGAGSQPLDGC